MTMQRMTARDFSQELLDLYDGYAHGTVSKRQFLDNAAKYAVGGVTAAGLLKSLQPNYALAQQVDPDDASIETSYIEYDSPEGHGTIKAYLTRPAGASDPLPAVLVVHENRGLNPYIEDVARRLARDGFMALAPDGLTPAGGYPGNDDEGRAMQKELDRGKLLADFFAGYEYLAARPDTTKIGAVGFCFGGGVCNALAVAYPELAASVPFYGRQPDSADVGKIKAAMLIHNAGLDDRINEGWPAYEEALKANGTNYTAHMYPDVNHGFHNDTTPRYDEPAAELAWQRTIDFFNEHLS